MEVENKFEAGKKKHNKNEAITYFRYIIRKQINYLEKCFIEENYDSIQMIIDYICEGNMEKMFSTIKEFDKDCQNSILIQRNDKGQNLIHILARNSHLIKDFNMITQFFKRLKEEGVSKDEKDQKQRTALHYAVKSGNLNFIKFLVDVEGFEVNE